VIVNGSSMLVQIPKRMFNVFDYHRMAEAGIITEDDRVELIEGEVVEMSPIGSLHAGCVNRLSALLHEQVGQTVIIAVQNPIRIDEYSEPQPDVARLAPRADFYSNGHPTPADVLLVIEVADTSVDYDRWVKIPLYARAGIAEVWFVNLPGDFIEIFSQPTGGVYKQVRRVGRGERLNSQSVPGIALSVDAILG
jgi:Uma2 family endonuclease